MCTEMGAAKEDRYMSTKPKLKPRVIIAKVPDEVHAYATKQAQRELMTVSTWVCRALTRMMQDSQAHEKFVKSAERRK